MTVTESSVVPERRLATVETISSLRDIPDADMIVAARIRGWDVVVKRDEFAVGDPCIYFEVDTLLDITDLRFAFLEPRGVRTDETGKSGHVLKTARMRGQYSQGLALPVSQFPEIIDPQIGDDLTGLLNLTKWDPPIPAELVGRVRGRLPSWIPATGEYRVQNIADVFTADTTDWRATEKIDGESSSLYVDPETDIDGVCTRRIDLLPTEGNAMWAQAAATKVHARLRETFPDKRAVVQGETFGEGIGKNPLKVKGVHFRAFALRVDGTEIPMESWPSWLADVAVPFHDLTFPINADEALAQVETLKSKISPERAAEGVVWRSMGSATFTTADGRVDRASFKVVSNRYLLKNS